jgi:hypothetical protein
MAVKSPPPARPSMQGAQGRVEQVVARAREVASRAGDGVVRLTEPLDLAGAGAVVDEHAEQAALEQLAERVPHVVGLVAVAVVVGAIDPVEPAPHVGDLVVAEDVVGQQREEAGPTVAVAADLEEHAHLVEHVGDQQAGAGVADDAGEGPLVEGAAVAGDLRGEDDEVAGAAQSVTI